ncbi:MAG: hypothetical protein RRY36_10405 [Bacteroidaceae bacterium]
MKKTNTLVVANTELNATQATVRALSQSIMSAAVKVDYTAKDVKSAAKSLKNSWLEQEGSLNSRCKCLIDNRDNVAVIQFFAKMGLKAKDVLNNKTLTPAMLVENWATREAVTEVCIRVRTYYVADARDDNNKIVDYYQFETKKLWSISDVVKLLQRIAAKNVVYNYYKLGEECAFTKPIKNKIIWKKKLKN